MKIKTFYFDNDGEMFPAKLSVLHGGKIRCDSFMPFEFHVSEITGIDYPTRDNKCSGFCVREKYFVFENDSSSFVHVLKGLSKQSLIEPRTRRIPRDVMLIVAERDGLSCCFCGSKSDLQFDHIIPFSLGGSNTANNVQILCESCNKKKYNTL